MNHHKLSSSLNLNTSKILCRNKTFNWQIDKRICKIKGALIFAKKDNILTTCYINSSAAIIWLMSDGTKSINDILTQIPIKYHKQSLEFINTLISSSMLTISEDFDKDYFESHLLSDNKFSKKPKIIKLGIRKLANEMQWESDFRMFFDKFQSHSQFYRPIKINVDITSRCNLKCFHCYYYTENESCIQKELSYQQIQLIIDKMVDSQIDMLNLFGGEPLIHNQIIDILDYAEKRGIKLSINTNGTLLTESLAAKIKHYNCNLILSLDGHNSQTHDAIRGDGNFQKLMKGVSLLEKYNVPFSIYHVLHKNNLKHFLRLYLLANKIRANVVGIIFLGNLGRTSTLQAVTPMSTLPNLLFCAIIRIFNKFYKLLNLNMTKIYISRCDSYMYAHLGVSGNTNFCQLCPDEINFGNIFDKSILEIWHSTRYTDFYNLNNVLGICKDCIFKHSCQKIYKCRLLDWNANNKDLFSGPTNCFIGKISLAYKKLTQIYKKKKMKQ